VFVCHVPAAPLVDDSGWLQRAMGVVHGVHAVTLSPSCASYRTGPPSINQSIKLEAMQRHTILTVRDAGDEAIQEIQQTHHARL